MLDQQMGKFLNRGAEDKGLDKTGLSNTGPILRYLPFALSQREQNLNFLTIKRLILKQLRLK